MARDVVDSEVVESRDTLVAWLEAGCKPAGPFRVGTEHEKIPFYRADHSPVPYDGERGIRALLEGMRGHLGWERIEDGENLIGGDGISKTILWRKCAGERTALAPGTSQ